MNLSLNSAKIRQMGKDIIDDIIRVEKEIEDRIENEKKSIEKWLNEIRLKAEEDILVEEQKNKQLLEQRVKTAKEEAKNRAGLLINKAIIYAKNLDSIDDNVLKEILFKHISKILPPLL